jgi:secreted PhoX family phosphatase
MITNPTGDRTGEAAWVPLSRTLAQVDSVALATAVGATGYNRPEDVETATSTGNTFGGGNVLYVAITGEDRVLAVDLRGPRRNTAFVSDYVLAGANAPADFDTPDNLALDIDGNLYITEDPGGNFAGGKRLGDDIWVARPSRLNPGVAEETVRFASLTDCDAEPTGVYFSKNGQVLYVNVQHRGGDGVDLGMAITRTRSLIR